MFCKRENRVGFLLKVSHDKDHKGKWVYQDFDPDCELDSDSKLLVHSRKLMSTLQSQTKAVQDRRNSIMDLEQW